MVEMGPKIFHRFRVTHVEAHVMTPGLFMEVVLVRRVEWICIPVQGEEKKERKKERRSHIPDNEVDEKHQVHSHTCLAQRQVVEYG